MTNLALYRSKSGTPTTLTIDQTETGGADITMTAGSGASQIELVIHLTGDELDHFVGQVFATYRP